MFRRLITVTALTAGLCVAAAMTLATPALAKGPSEARITGPGLARAIVVSGQGEPGQPDALAVLAGQTGFFSVMFGAGALAGVQAPAQLRTAPPRSSLGPRYTVTYTVPGLTPGPGEQFGVIRQDLYPDAVGGPVVFTPPGQEGFGGPLQVTGWLIGGRPLARTLAQLGVPVRPGTRAAPPSSRPAARPAAAHHAGSASLAWLIAVAAALAAAALAGTALRVRRRKAPAGPDREPQTSGRAAGSA
jgi:hypothetical protein